MRRTFSFSSPALPVRVNAHVLARFFREGDPVVVLVARGVGSTQPYEFCDKEGRCYVMKWEAGLDGHVLRLPWTLWMADEGRLAEVMLNQRRLPFAMVVLVEWVREEEDARVGEVSRGEGGKGADGGWLADGAGKSAHAPLEVGKGAEGDLEVDPFLCYSRMREMLGGGALRLRALGWGLGLEEKELREVLEGAGCPAVVTPTGWVKLRATEVAGED
ncbi:hypothetical protein EI77_04704 [Prosthecobacter fusiformis]|uniref:Uncharacterized protein n=1 Tax=Prosthecobacter fusiformis TaxID=48464 RepID=A0A4R7RJ68_9BACT|nr:hypothetical protein [Prosthecobacter fusiformis]TDU62480.1 hypothetical protein EI77_04704 [Prosthecobacter fusiformis]